MRPSFQEKILFHQDNAHTHENVLEIAKMNELKYELLELLHQRLPSDYYFFRRLKQFVRGKRFSSKGVAVSDVDENLAL